MSSENLNTPLLLDYSRAPIAVHRMKTVKYITLTLVVCIILLSSLYVNGTGDWNRGGIAIASCTFFLIPLIFRSLGYRKYVRYLFFVVFYFILLFTGILLGIDANMPFGIMLIPIGLKVFIRNNLFSKVLIFIASLTSVFLIYHYHTTADPVRIVNAWAANIISVATVSIVCWQLLEHYYYQVRYKQSQVVEAFKVLEVKNHYIADQNEKFRKANHRIERINVKILNEVKERKKAEERLKEANEDLAQFATIASHDLKEPLRTITSFGGLLTRSLKNSISASQAEYLFYMTDAAKRMTTMLEDLISYARAGKDVSDNTPLDLNDVLLVVRKQLQLTILEKDANVNLQCEKLPVIFGQFTHFVQLFQNIISNAIKFQVEGEKPIINIYCTTQENECMITIEDNGIGIANEYLERIFEPFARLHTRDQYEGSGIGLATCKKIVERYGGQLKVSSVVGQGTTFFIQLSLTNLDNAQHVDTLVKEDKAVS